MRSLPKELAGLRFDPDTFDQLRRAYAAGELDPRKTRLPAAPLELESRDVREVEGITDAQLEGALEAISQGKLAIVVMNGGMATRFGGVPKGVVPVVEDGPSFLQLKLAQVRTLQAHHEARIPVVVMNSFATRAVSREHLRAHDWGGVPAEHRIEFDQSLFPRLKPDGSTWFEDRTLEETDLEQLFHAPGHGDTLLSLIASGTLKRLRELGVEHILVSNVDNLGASPDPRVFAAHLEACRSGAEMSGEMVRREEHDVGGCVARVQGSLEIVEAFRLPEGVTMAQYDYFNTNTLWFTLEAVEREFRDGGGLDWFAVRKRAPIGTQTRDVLQFETLIGQASARLNFSPTLISRERFVPVKTRDELRALAPWMHQQIDALREQLS